MAGAKALTYAEETLRVHAVYHEAQDLATQATELRQAIAGMRRVKSDLETMYLDAEYDFISDLRGANKDMSQTAFDKFAKQEIHRDPSLRSLRADLAEHGHKIERADIELSNVKVRIDIATARLHELGGYFAYLAALKNTAQKKSEDWPPSPPDYRPGASAPQH